LIAALPDAASLEVDGPVTSTPPDPARPTVVVELDDALPVVAAEPEELAVPTELVPGAAGIFAELPAPLGSFAELLRPPTLAGPLGTPLIALEPAPAEPALGVPAADPVPADGPLAAPPADPAPLPWASAPMGESKMAMKRNLAATDIGALRLWFRRQCRGDISCSRRLFDGPMSRVRYAPENYFLVQSRIMPVDGVGQDAVQIPPEWMLGCRVAPSFDKHVTEAITSPAEHSEVHPIDPHAVPSIDLA
jgi:hypothetical protein